MGSAWWSLGLDGERLPKEHPLVLADRADYGWLEMPGMHCEDQHEVNMREREYSHQAVYVLECSECYKFDQLGNPHFRRSTTDEWELMSHIELKMVLRKVLARLVGTSLVAPSVRMIDDAVDLARQALVEGLEDIEVQYGDFYQPDDDAY